MNKVLWSDFGVELIQKNDRLFIRYDSGELVMSYVEDEITEVEATSLQRGEDEAYKVILAAQNRRFKN
jgi:hypothetical protein